MSYKAPGLITPPVFGLETEYSAFDYGPRSSKAEKSMVQGLINASLRAIVGSALDSDGSYPDKFTPFGGRVYIDTGNHLEVATPECTLLRDILLYDKVGDLLVTKIIADAYRSMDEQGIEGTLHAHKNCNNGSEKSGRCDAWGSHENYFTGKEITPPTVIKYMGPFAATRQLFSGSGQPMYSENPGEPSLHMSPRARFIETDFTIASTSMRGIINTRDEPHADRDRFRRLHYMAGDPNMLDWATVMKFGMTSLTLGLLHIGECPHIPLKNDSNRVLNLVSEDIAFDKLYNLRETFDNMGKMSAIDIQEVYLSAIEENRDNLAEFFEHDPWYEKVLDMWRKGVDSFRGGDHRETLHGVVEWITKLNVMEKYHEFYVIHKRGNFGWNSLSSRLDSNWQRLYPDEKPTILTRLLDSMDSVPDAHLAIPRLVDLDRIEAGMHTPPEGTRANIRGGVVKYLQDLRKNGVDTSACAINWHYISTEGERYYFSDDPRVQDFSRKLEDGTTEVLTLDMIHGDENAQDSVLRPEDSPVDVF